MTRYEDDYILKLQSLKPGYKVQYHKTGEPLKVAYVKRYNP